MVWWTQWFGANSVFMVPARDTRWSGEDGVVMVPARHTHCSGAFMVRVPNSLVKTMYKFTKPARDTRFPCIRSFKTTRHQSQTLSLFLISVQYSYEQIFI